MGLRTRVEALEDKVRALQTSTVQWIVELENKVRVLEEDKMQNDSKGYPKLNPGQDCFWCCYGKPLEAVKMNLVAAIVQLETEVAKGALCADYMGPICRILCALAGESLPPRAIGEPTPKPGDERWRYREPKPGSLVKDCYEYFRSVGGWHIDGRKEQRRLNEMVLYINRRIQRFDRRKHDTRRS